MYATVFLAFADWWETFNNNFSNLETTAKNGGKAVAVVIVLSALVMGRMLVKVISAILLVGVALYAVFNISSIEDKTTQTIEGSEESMIVINAPPPGIDFRLGTLHVTAT